MKARVATFRQVFPDSQDAQLRLSPERRATTALRNVFDDSQEAQALARALVRDARSLAREVETGGSSREINKLFAEHLGVSSRGMAREDEPLTIIERFTNLIIESLGRDLARGGVARPPDEVREFAEELSQALAHARAARQLTPEARAARLELEIGNAETDDLRALLVTPEDRTRAEHADHLNQTNLSARDLYERGADMYGDVLVIPSDPHEREQARDEVKIGSLAYAVKTFERFTDDESAARQAAIEFVELAQTIAGRTADSDMRLAVFKSYYDHVRRDHTEETYRQRDNSEVRLSERGEFLPAAEQRERLDAVLEEMRELAQEMCQLEWKPDRGEMIEIGAWEQSLHARQRDGEDELSGYRTQVGEQIEPEEDSREINPGRALVEHESVRLDKEPPLLPRELESSRMQVAALLSEVDRRLAQGARPNEIQNYFTTQELQQEKREQKERIRTLFERRGVPIEQEARVTREAELAALYMLRAMTTSAEGSGRAARATAEIDRRIEELQPYTIEQLTALNLVREKAARSLEAEEERLAAFARTERGLSTLERIEVAYREHVRSTPEWQEQYAHLRTAEGTAEVTKRRSLLAEELEVPLITEHKQKLAAEVNRFQARYREITGRDDLTSAEACTLVAPRLDALRGLRDRTAGEIESLRERTGAPLPERSEEAPLRGGLYLSLPMNDRVRLPVASFAEYQILSRLAENLNRAEHARDRVSVPLSVSDGMWRAGGLGESNERARLFQFARDYASFRAQDAQTQLRASSALARDYLQRLEKARTPEEMLRAVTEIKRENRDRREHPEKFRASEEYLNARGELAHRPLRDDELRQVFLASSPDHHTAEMRSVRLEAAAHTAGRAKQERARQLADLEQGRVRLSPELHVLLTELERVRSPRDLKLFYAQMLNDSRDLPVGLPRISREDLYAAHEKLSRVERDFVFGRMEGRRAELTRTSEERTTARAYVELSREDQTKSIWHDNESYKAYTAAVTARTDVLLTRWQDESLRSQMASGDKNQRLITNDLERTVTYAGVYGTAELARALAPFQKSPRLRDRQLHELVTALATRETHARDERGTEVMVRARQGSELTPAQWQKALEYIAPRLDARAAEERTRILEPVRDSLRAQAIREAWEQLRPDELKAPEKLSMMLVSTARVLIDQDAAVGKAVEAQTRARIADRAWREMQDKVIERAQAQTRDARDHDDLPTQAWKTMARDVLQGITLAQTVERAKTQKFAGKSLSESDSSHIYHAIDKVIEAPERERANQLAAYAALTRIRFVGSFEAIDQSRVKAHTALLREHEQDERGRVLVLDRLAPEVESLSYRTFSHERDGYVGATLGQEVARLMRDDRAGFETALGRAESNALMRDLVPAEKRMEVEREAVSRGFWKLMPEEIRRPAEGGQHLPRNVERAAMQVSELIERAMLIERGLHTSHEQDGRGNGERLLREGFREIDHAQTALAEAKVEAERQERREIYQSLRPALAESINGYLKGVLELHGERAFERGKGLTHHTEMTAQIIRDTFSEQNVAPERAGFTEERIQSLARAIIEPLPQQLAYARTQAEEKTLGRHDHQLDQSRLRESSHRGSHDHEMQEHGRANDGMNRHHAIERNAALQAERSDDFVPLHATSIDAPTHNKQPAHDDHTIAVATKIKQREIVLTR